MSGSSAAGSDLDLVTGEAVALDMPPASLGVRALSGLLDIFFTMIIGSTVLVVSVIPLAQAVDPAAAAAILVAAMIAVFVGIPTFLETRYGKTLAKMIVGLRTVRDDGGPITFRHAFTRQLVGFVEVYALAGFPALLSGLLNPRAKRIGDLAAGTYVVRDRMRFPAPHVGVMPPPLAAWAAVADIAPIPDLMALAIRELLSRAPEIRPEPRYALASDLARQAITYVSPRPPHGTPPEVFLEALLVERRRRDGHRLAREEALRRRLLGLPATPIAPTSPNAPPEPGWGPPPDLRVTARGPGSSSG